ncbi:MAG: hypothetical protein ACRDQA_21155 [Nocardioidaceae bacterium]
MSTSHPDAAPPTNVPVADADALTSPSARRLGARRWRDPRLWLGVLLVLAAMVVGAKVLAAADDSIAVWRLSHDIPAGVVVTTDDLRSTDVHFSDTDLANAYVPVTEQLATGTRVTRDLAAGDLLSRSAISTDKTSAAKQLPLAVPAAGLPVGLQVGDHVAVWGVPDRPPSGDGGGAAHGAPARLALPDVVVTSLGPQSGAGLSAGRQIVVALERGTSVAKVLSATNGSSIVLVRLGG